MNLKYNKLIETEAFSNCGKYERNRLKIERDLKVKTFDKVVVVVVVDKRPQIYICPGYLYGCVSTLATIRTQPY